MAKGAMRLEAGKVVETLDHLQARIAERFPESGLARVCAQLTATARATARRAQRLSRPYPAVNDIETLTSDLGRKIWQKIMILGQLDEARA